MIAQAIEEVDDDINEVEFEHDECQTANN